MGDRLEPNGLSMAGNDFGSKSIAIPHLFHIRQGITAGTLSA